MGPRLQGSTLLHVADNCPQLPAVWVIQHFTGRAQHWVYGWHGKPAVYNITCTKPARWLTQLNPIPHLSGELFHRLFEHIFPEPLLTKHRWGCWIWNIFRLEASCSQGSSRAEGHAWPRPILKPSSMRVRWDMYKYQKSWGSDKCSKVFSLPAASRSNVKPHKGASHPEPWARVEPCWTPQNGMNYAGRFLEPWMRVAKGC